MRKVFVDAAAWIALVNKDDYLHSQSARVREQLWQEKCRLITTDFVLLEVADALSAFRLRAGTIAYINQLRQMRSIKIFPVSEALFKQGWYLYEQRLDQNWGLTDCISFVVMNQENITTAFTSDRHFEQAGFVRLLNPKADA